MTIKNCVLTCFLLTTRRLSFLCSEQYGLWDREDYWRHYGDIENNWGLTGNQQALAEAALAEKIVNSIDARLINECLMQDIDPSGPKAPNSMQLAVAQFFDDDFSGRIETGNRIESWGREKILEVASGITFCATGARSDILNITIADSGEGQTPDKFPKTILSLSGSNKIRIPFVQGQFNQGGTGAFRFCGKRNLQLVVSKRNPKILKRSGAVRDREWGFTVVRRERPSKGRKNSMHTYLAPMDVETGGRARKGRVLSFEAESLPIFPNESGPYERRSLYGTAIKMYEYQHQGGKQHILGSNSLLSRLDLLLPDIALPVCFYEHRKNRRGARQEITSGLRLRLMKSSDVESGFPVAMPIQIDGERLIVSIFAFKANRSMKDQAEKNKGEKKTSQRGYRKREGVVFIRNGQTQGSLPKDFFRRDAVKMKPISDDILVFVECDELDGVVREDLFMPSRDRLVDNDFRRALVDALEKTVRDCQELKDLRNRRQQERTGERLKDDREFADVLQSLIKKSPNLTALLEQGQRIAAPFRTEPTGSSQTEEFKGAFFPTFFKIKDCEYGVTLKRSCAINRRMKLTFETDAANDYFTRPSERGSFDLTWIDKDGGERKASPSGPNLRNGIAVVMLELPGNPNIGEEIEFIACVRGAHDPFENRILVTVGDKAKKRQNGGDGRRHPPASRDGSERERPSSVSPPKIKEVYRDDWDSARFDEATAMKMEVGYSADGETEEYTFKVNMDNASLENESKHQRLDRPQYELMRRQFLYANVLVGLSVLLDEKNNKNKIKRDAASSASLEDPEERPESVEDRIERTCRVLAPFLPTLVSLGTDLTVDDQIEGLEESD